MANWVATSRKRVFGGIHASCVVRDPSTKPDERRREESRKTPVAQLGLLKEAVAGMPAVRTTWTAFESDKDDDAMLEELKMNENELTSRIAPLG